MGTVSERGLWAAAAVGPLAWAATLLGNSLLSDLACGPNISIWLIALVVAMLVATVGASLVAWRSARVASSLSHDPQQIRHLSFLAHAALLSSGLFAVAIIALAVPPALLHDCH